MEPLKKCPFCGADVDMVSGTLVKLNHLVCQNPNCGADVWFYGAEDKPGLMVLRWNRRVNTDDTK